MCLLIIDRTYPHRPVRRTINLLYWPALPAQTRRTINLLNWPALSVQTRRTINLLYWPALPAQTRRTSISCTDLPFERTVQYIYCSELVRRADQYKRSVVLSRPLVVLSWPLLYCTIQPATDEIEEYRQIRKLKIKIKN